MLCSLNIGLLIWRAVQEIKKGNTNEDEITGVLNQSRKINHLDHHAEDDSLSYLELRESLKKRKCTCANVTFWLAISIMFLLTALVTLQPMYEAFGRPGALPGE